MSPIDRIAKLRHPGILRDFSWPENLPDFGRYNLIYGWNGSGKTTISRIFQALETRTPPSNCEVELTIQGQRTAGQDFLQSSLPVRVFNRDFVSLNVVQTAGGDVPPILVLGEDSVEKQSKVEELKEDLRSAEFKRDLRQSQSSSDESNLDTHCIGQARGIKDTLRSSGQNVYNNFNKTNYHRRAIAMLEAGDREQHHLDDDVRTSQQARIHEAPKARIGEIGYTFPQLPRIFGSVEKLLQTTVVSATIQALKDDQELSSWVHEGIALHESYSAQQCLFCEQNLPQNRLDRLKAHFNAAYEKLINNIDEQIVQVEKAAEDSESIVLPHCSQFYEELSDQYENALEQFKCTQQMVKQTMSFLVDALESKKGQVFVISSLDVVRPNLAVETVEAVNMVIRAHNSRCDDFESVGAAARNSLAADMVSVSLNEYISLTKKAEEARSAATLASNEVARMGAEIAQLEQEIVEHRRPATELNEDLRKYLGHGELQLTVKDTGYAITRGGEPAQSLRGCLKSGHITPVHRSGG